MPKSEFKIISFFFLFFLIILFTWYFACCVYGCTLLFHLLIYFILHFSIFSLIFLFIFYPISFGIYISIYVCRIENLKRPSGYTQRLCGYIWFEFVLVRCSLDGIEEKMLAFRPFSIGCLIRGRERERSEKMMMKVNIVYSPVTLYSWCRTAIYKSSNWTRTQLPRPVLRDDVERLCRSFSRILTAKNFYPRLCSWII